MNRIHLDRHWGTQTHRVAVLDSAGHPVEQYNADHSGEGLVTLVNKLKQRTACEPVFVAIGIEVAWGALVETLVEGGFTVFSINPKQVGVNPTLLSSGAF